MDETEFDPGATSKKKKISQFVQEIIEEIHYYDTILPRIPVMIQRTMQVCFSFCSLPEGFFFLAEPEKEELSQRSANCSVYYRLRLAASLRAATELQQQICNRAARFTTG